MAGHAPQPRGERAMRPDRRTFVKLTAGFGLVASAPSLFAHPVPRLKITGPLPTGAQAGYPFRGLSDQPAVGGGLPLPELTPFDYVEEEYFISGTVGAAPFQTSLLVRKPRN